MSEFFDLVVQPLYDWQRAVHKATGTRPMAEVYVHSALYDELIAETLAKMTDPHPGPFLVDGHEGMVFLNDITLRPERARPRKIDGTKP